MSLLGIQTQSIIGTIKEKFSEEFVWYDRLVGGRFWKNAPYYADKPINTRSAMIALVRIVKPKNFLEIVHERSNVADEVAKTMQSIHGEGNFTIDSLNSNQWQKGVHASVRTHHWLPHHTEYTKDSYTTDRNLSNDEIIKRNKETLADMAGKKKYDMIYICSDHSYEGVNFEFDYCRTVSHENTVIVLDDIYGHIFPGVKRAMEDFPASDEDRWDFIDWNNNHPDQVMNIGLLKIDEVK